MNYAKKHNLICAFARQYVEEMTHQDLLECAFEHMIVSLDTKSPRQLVNEIYEHNPELLEEFRDVPYIDAKLVYDALPTTIPFDDFLNGKNDGNFGLTEQEYATIQSIKTKLKE